MAPELESGAATGNVRVIIQTKGRASADLDAAISKAGGSKRNAYEALDAMVADVPANSLASLAAREDIAYISPDRAVKSQGSSFDNETTGAAQVQAGAPSLTGKGISIAVIDSGISSNHPDFNKNGKSRIRTSFDFTGSARKGNAFGHGTGVAAGSGAASTGYAANYAGIAPEASLVDLRVLDETGSARISTVLAAINWAITNSARYNVRIINMSLGAPVRKSYKVDPLCQAVERAIRAGLVVVASAGNYGHTSRVVGYDNNGKPLYELRLWHDQQPRQQPVCAHSRRCRQSLDSQVL
ncbi:MAG TPA: S8 family serine peptidase [Pyrinomonadaceae bacterium]|nr:S8 family serine peptidase [Pyrinomonadaceae bacterium]